MKKISQFLVLSSLVVLPVQVFPSYDNSQDSITTMEFAAFLFDFALYHQAFGPSDNIHEQEIQEVKEVFLQAYNDGSMQIKDLNKFLQSSFQLSEFCETMNVNYDLLGVDRQVTMLELFSSWTLVDHYLIKLLIDLGYNVDNEAQRIISRICKDLTRINLSQRERQDLENCLNLIVNAASTSVQQVLYFPK